MQVLSNRIFEWCQNLNQISILVGVTFYFLLIYFFMAGLFVLARKAGLGRLINSRVLFENQILCEIRNSMLSILIFGFYGMLMVFLFRNGFLNLNQNFNWTTFTIESLVLLTWNEIHFFLVHSLLHTSWLFKKVHKVHHRSVVTTPFSTYSFHWIESALLGSVMVIIAYLHDFQIISLMFFPVMSLFFNAMGHSNIEFFKTERITELLGYSTRHNFHHTKSKSGKGFITPYLDMLFKSNI